MQNLTALSAGRRFALTCGYENQAFQAILVVQQPLQSRGNAAISNQNSK
jgi:hypothetical protein